MAENKTQPNDASVEDFLQGIEHEQKRKDSFAILAMMEEITQCKPQMWGDTIIGFGQRQLKYESGRELDWFWVGFSPRKQNLTMYIMPGFGDYSEVLERLGKHKTGKSCLYINKLKDVNEEVLRELIEASVAEYAQDAG